MTVTIDDAAGAGEAISNDIISCNFTTSRGVQDVTGLNKSAMERLLLLNDFTLDLVAVFNPAGSPSMFDVLSTPADNDTRTVVIVVGDRNAIQQAIEALKLDSRDADIHYHVGSLYMTSREYDKAIGLPLAGRGRGVFHLMFRLAFHVSGAEASFEIPFPAGPRNPGQSSPDA